MNNTAVVKEVLIRCPLCKNLYNAADYGECDCEDNSTFERIRTSGDKQKQRQLNKEKRSG